SSESPLAGFARRFKTGGALETRLVQLILGTVLFVLGFFFAAQAYLIYSEISGAQQAEVVRDWEAQALGAKVTEIRQRVLQAGANDALLGALSQPLDTAQDPAAALLKQALPEVLAASFHKADIADVISSDFAQFGYAKAAILVQAHRMHGAGPLQAVQGPD